MQLTLEDFGGITHMDLAFEREVDERTVLLHGPSGSGKTSVLRALALAARGGIYTGRWPGLDPRELVRNGTNRARATLHGDSPSIRREVTCTVDAQGRGKWEHTSTGEPLPLPLFAYGVRACLPHDRRVSPREREGFGEVVTLFESDTCPVGPANLANLATAAFLAKHHGKRTQECDLFEDVSFGLLRLMQNSGMSIEVGHLDNAFGSHALVKRPGHSPCRLDFGPASLRSLVSIFMDLCTRLAQRTSHLADGANVPCTVLLDDAHLLPEYALAGLKTAFPNAVFICTATHEVPGAQLSLRLPNL